MQCSIIKICGAATAINTNGLRRQLKLDDIVLENETISVSENGKISIKVSEHNVFEIDSLQTIKLTSDVFDSNKEALESTLPSSLLNDLFDVYPDLSALNDSFQENQEKMSALNLYSVTGDDVILPYNDVLDIDRELGDLTKSNNAIFMSKHSDGNSEDTKKMISIDSIGYNSHELLAFLIDNYPVLDEG